MDVLMTRDTVIAKKVNKSTKENQVGDVMKDTTNKGRSADQNENDHVSDETNGPRRYDNETEMFKKQLAMLSEENRILQKQLESRDVIIKKQISEIHRLQGENKAISEEKVEIKNERDNLKKDYEAEQWLGERLKHDVRDLQMQLDFQDCYLQEQSHQSNLMDNLLGELQKRNEAQEKEIIQLRQQLHSGKEKVDNQIVQLQRILSQIRN